MPAQFNGAVWNSIIHGASGQVIFYHCFVGLNGDPLWDAVTQYNLYDNVWYEPGGDFSLGVNYCACYGTPALGVLPPDDPAWQISFSNFQGLRAGIWATGMPAQVPATIAAVQALAPVINTQTLEWVFHPSLETALKVPGDGFAYIFAMQNILCTSGTYTLTLPAGITGTTVTVLNESRTIPVISGAFTDSFSPTVTAPVPPAGGAEYAVHIYKIAI